MPSAARLVDLDSDQVQHYLRIVNDSNRRQWGEASKDLTVEDLRLESTKSENDQRYYLWWVDDLAVGALELLLHRDDPEGGWIEVHVDHEYEGYRVGKRLLEFGENLARRGGRHYLRGMSHGRSLRDDRATRFLKKAGYNELSSMLRQDLILPNEKFNSCQSCSAPGMEVVVVQGVPDISVCEEICRLWFEQYSEDRGSESKPPDYSPVGLQQFQQRIVESGRYTQFALLVDQETTDIVGLSEMDYRPGEAFAEQFETYVAPSVRSIETAHLLKCVGTHKLVEACPDVPRIRTLNPTRNTQMIEVNEKLGFTGTGYYREWEKRLD